MSIFGFLFSTLLTISMLRRFSPVRVDAFFLRFSPGISSFTPIPRACFSLGSDSWNTPTEAVDAFTTFEAVMSCLAEAESGPTNPVRGVAIFFARAIFFMRATSFFATRSMRRSRFSLNISRYGSFCGTSNTQSRSFSALNR
uniref:Putative secreted protein n=1 Tax=Anopheles marajoara TaxID=58244 RepID=A0A2M4C6T3_9DIPT